MAWISTVVVMEQRCYTIFHMTVHCPVNYKVHCVQDRNQKWNRICKPSRITSNQSDTTVETSSTTSSPWASSRDGVEDSAVNRARENVSTKSISAAANLATIKSVDLVPYGRDVCPQSYRTSKFPNFPHTSQPGSYNPCWTLGDATATHTDVKISNQCMLERAAQHTCRVLPSSKPESRQRTIKATTDRWNSSRHQKHPLRTRSKGLPGWSLHVQEE